jgi:dimethylhistidine N-methyltransferase
MADDTGLEPRQTDPRVVAAALAGLRAPRKTLPPWLFYDEAGCRLFYQITELPEYYLTRAERVPLARAAEHVAALMPSGSTLVEYGASDETKALTLLVAGAGAFTQYVPIDVAESELGRVRLRLGRRLPALAVRPITADFMDRIVLPPGEPRLGFFPGSTIGNLEPEQARAFLERARMMLGSGARFLLGADIRKDAAILVPAYDDAQGITAAFNRNLLLRLNRDAAATFNPSLFRHQAVWNDQESRIEMHLVSTADHIVSVADHIIHFSRHETIHTENSYKHTPERLIGLADDAGWRLSRQWTDPETLFGVFLFEDHSA